MKHLFLFACMLLSLSLAAQDVDFFADAGPNEPVVYNADVADYPAFPAVKDSVYDGVYFLIGPTWGVHSLSYGNSEDLSLATGSGMDYMVSAMVHGAGELSWFFVLEGGYRSASARTRVITNIRRDNFLFKFGVGLSGSIAGIDGVLNGGMVFGHLHSTKNALDTQVLGFTGLFKYPVGGKWGTQRIWIRAGGDIGMMFTDQFTATNRKPFTGSVNFGVLLKF